MAKPEEKPNDDLKQLRADLAALSVKVAALAEELKVCEGRQRRHHQACACPAQW